MAPLCLQSDPQTESSTDDMELLRRYVQEGCEASFAEIVRRHLNWVYSICRRGLKDPHLAEDATQAVFLILARRAKTISPNVHLSGWLFKACRFAVQDARKKEFRHQRRQDLGMRLGIERMEEAEASAERSADSISGVLDDALALLKESDRQALMLHFYEGMTIPEMAVALGVSAEGAKKRVTRALKRLRDQFTRRKIAVSIGILCSFFYGHASDAAPLGLCETVSMTALGQAPIPISTAAIAQGIVNLMTHAAGRLWRALLVAELATVTIVGGISLLRNTSSTLHPQPAPVASLSESRKPDSGVTGVTPLSSALSPSAQGPLQQLFVPSDSYISQEHRWSDPAVNSQKQSGEQTLSELAASLIKEPVKASALPEAGVISEGPAFGGGGGSWGGIGGPIGPLPPVRQWSSVRPLDFLAEPLAALPEHTSAISVLPVIPKSDPPKKTQPDSDLFRLALTPDSQVDLDKGIVFQPDASGNYSIYVFDNLNITGGFAEGYLAPGRYSPDELNHFRDDFLDLHSSAVPEPTSVGLLLACASSLLLRRRRRYRA